MASVKELGGFAVSGLGLGVGGWDLCRGTLVFGSSGCVGSWIELFVRSVGLALAGF